MLADAVEDPCVAAEAALVRQGSRDVRDVELGRVRGERVDSSPTHGLDVRPRVHQTSVQMAMIPAAPRANS